MVRASAGNKRPRSVLARTYDRETHRRCQRNDEHRELYQIHTGLDLPAFVRATVTNTRPPPPRRPHSACAGAKRTSQRPTQLCARPALSVTRIHEEFRNATLNIAYSIRPLLPLTPVVWVRNTVENKCLGYSTLAVLCERCPV